MNGDPRSHGLWAKSAPQAPNTRPLVEDLRVEVAIIGGGYTGCSAALHLAEGGARVALLEGAEIGFGGSGRNVGLVNAGMWVMPEDLPRELGPLYGERLLEMLGNAPQVVFDLVRRHGISCELVTQGTLHCAVGAKGHLELEERARQWQARGAPVHLLDKEETSRKVGTSAYAGSLLDERAGTIQPLAYVRGLATAAMARGVALFTQSPVIASEETDTTTLLRTPRGTLSARHVIVATDAYTTNIWPAIGREQVRLPYFNMATVPLSDNLRRSILPERQGVWDTKPVLSSFRFDQSGRLVFGSVGALRGSGLAIHRNWGRRALCKLFPQLRGVAFESEWYGRIGMTDNSLPRFHRLGRNAVAMGGYNGRGIAPGTVFGRCLAQLLLGEISEADLPLPVTEAVATPRRVLQETSYEFGAQVIHLAGARF